MRTCPKCNKPHNNVFGGVVIMQKDKQTLEVCAACADKMRRKGWHEIGRQR